MSRASVAAAITINKQLLRRQLQQQHLQHRRRQQQCRKNNVCMIRVYVALTSSVSGKR